MWMASLSLNWNLMDAESRISKQSVDQDSRQGSELWKRLKMFEELDSSSAIVCSWTLDISWGYYDINGLFQSQVGSFLIEVSPCLSGITTLSLTFSSGPFSAKLFHEQLKFGYQLVERFTVSLYFAVEFVSRKDLVNLNFGLKYASSCRRRWVPRCCRYLGSYSLPKLSGSYNAFVLTDQRIQMHSAIWMTSTPYPLVMLVMILSTILQR